MLCLSPPQRGLASITTSAVTEAGKSTDVVQKAQVSPDATKGKSTKESPPIKGEILSSENSPFTQLCTLVSML